MSRGRRLVAAIMLSLALLGASAAVAGAQTQSAPRVHGHWSPSA